MIQFSIYKNIINHANKLRDFVLDILFPIECAGCGSEGEWLCHKCFGKIKFKQEQYCLHCKKENKFGRFCPDCRQLYSLDGVLIAGDYDNRLIAKLIKNLKYNFVRDIAGDLGKFLILFLQNLNSESGFGGAVLAGGNLIIPVPLHNKRRRWRGFNQAELIAREVSGYFKLELSVDKLIRIKYKKPQIKLSEAERKSNIIGCFGWRGENLNGRDVVLIDDIVTTGATLNECAKVLKQNGAGKVWGLAAAKG
ncbi:ComF family protein [Patescibacteria group bacterium]|nr:ComF family protein [Patescibacteria group bacterium]